MQAVILTAVLSRLAITTNAAVITPFPGLPENVSSVFDVRSAMDRDSRYAVWDTPSRIPYKLDPSYNAQEIRIIKLALNAVSESMKSCIRFIPFDNNINSGQDFIYFGKTTNEGKTPLTCFSFPGRVVKQNGNGQKVALVSGSTGCLGNVREAMKYIVHCLGLRNEYNRPDRNLYIQVFPQNVRPELLSADLLKMYTPNQVDYLNSLFDYQSITIPSPQKFAIPGGIIFSPVNASQTFGSQPTLSMGDCQALSLIYNTCIFSQCSDPYAVVAPSTTTSSTWISTTEALALSTQQTDPFAGIQPMEPDFN